MNTPGWLPGLMIMLAGIGGLVNAMAGWIILMVAGLLLLAKGAGAI